MNSEKSYDSLPNFTAADCKYLIVLKKVMFRLCLCILSSVNIVMCVFNLKYVKNGNSKQHISGNFIRWYQMHV